MPETPPIAVVIPCYNHADVLRRTLKALFLQSLRPAEIVVVDDGSADDARSVVDGLSPTEQQAVRFVRFEKNRGAPAARNEGARLTTSPYLLFLDADAELVPTALEKMSQALESDPMVDFAYSNFRWGNRLFKLHAFDSEKLKHRNYIHTSSLVRRSAFPGFDETLKKFQDWDLWLTMSERGSKGVWIDEELYRIEPRRKGQGMSGWLPRFVYHLPWKLIHWMPREVKRFRVAEAVIKQKHHL